MGNVFHWNAQPKEIRIIYVVESAKRRIFPIRWPDSFAQFVLELHELFPMTRDLAQPRFLFKDASEFQVCIVSESTFQALIPSHKQIAPTVDVYYVVLESWIV